MRFSKSVLAISIAMAVSGVAGAATKSNENDSVHEWGRWAVLMPAAGPEAGPDVAAIPAGNDLGSCESSGNCPKVVLAVVPEPPAPPVEPPAPPVEPPVPPVEPPPVVEGHCVAGAACGYASYQYSYSRDDYYNYGYGGDYGEGEGYVPADEREGAPVPAYIDLRLVTADGGEGAAYDIDAAGNNPEYPSDAGYPPVDSRTPESGDGSTYTDGDIVSWYSNVYNENDSEDLGGNPGYSYYWSRINGQTAPDVTGDSSHGDWNDGVEGYTDYSEGASGYYTLSERFGQYVWGTTTGGTMLDSLRVGDVEATYVGATLNAGVPVVINVDFGSSSWSGSWNNGVDGATASYTDAHGVHYRDGQVGFNARGVVSGPNIVSTQVSAADTANVRGRVEGSFFGPQAQVLGGVSDITKDGERNVEVFVTVEESRAERLANRPQ